ncbi:MAG: hypothetical protein JOZ92_06420 [Candidatus Dormibacteraeota bacterium]|nr:hypothetical protein [Candidatus Dormibacteraeota bacterium]
MTQRRSVSLISDDLLFASRLQAAFRRVGGEFALVVGDQVPQTPTIFVDLNSRTDERVATITRLRQERPAVEIVGFCNHDDRALRRRALAAGATRVVNNSALQTVALLLAGYDVRDEL